MACVEKGYCDSFRDFDLLVIAHTDHLIYCLPNIFGCIERFHERLVPLPVLFVHIFDIALLDISAVVQHDIREITRCTSSIDFSPKAVPDEIGQIAGVIDVSMRKHDGIDG